MNFVNLYCQNIALSGEPESFKTHNRQDPGFNLKSNLRKIQYDLLHER